MSVTQTDVLQDMSYLLGEQTIPSSGIDDRKQFIQRGLERIYRAYNWQDLKSIATVSLTNGIGTLPTDFISQGDADIRVVNAGSDYIFERINYNDQDDPVQGDYKWWLTGYQGSYTFNSKETTIPAVTLRYTQTAPTINASISTSFPSSMVIARAALVYYRQSENPLADITQDEALFKNELQEVIAHEIRNKPTRRAKSIAEKFGTYTGQI